MVERDRVGLGRVERERVRRGKRRRRRKRALGIVGLRRRRRLRRRAFPSFEGPMNGFGSSASDPRQRRRARRTDRVLLLRVEDGGRTAELVFAGLCAATEQTEGTATLLVVVVDVDLCGRGDDVRRLPAVDRRPEAVVPSDDAVAE